MFASSVLLATSSRELPLSNTGSNGVAETPLPPPRSPPSPNQASCDEHSTCSAQDLLGLCCPTAGGMRLDCCDSPPSPPASPPSPPPSPPAPCKLSRSPTADASLAVQSVRLLTNTFETCTVPTSYGLNRSSTLASLLCNRAADSSVPSSPALTFACTEVHDSSNCDASAIVVHLLEAQRAGVSGAECCNALQRLSVGDSDDSDEWRVVCQRGGALLPLLALPALLVLALLLDRLRRRQSFFSCCSITSVLSGRCCTSRAQHPAEASDPALERAELGASALSTATEGTSYQDTNRINQEALGRQLLHIASSASEERRQIEAIVLRHTKTFGLQPDSAANQARAHFTQSRFPSSAHTI